MIKIPKVLVDDITNSYSLRLKACYTILDNLFYLSSASFSNNFDLDIHDELLQIVIENLLSLSDEILNITSECKQYYEGDNIES